MTDTNPLNFLDQAKLPTSTPESHSPTPTAAPLEVLPPPLNPVLMRLPESKRPPATLACASCPAAVWLAGPTTPAQNFCRIMHTLTWSAQEQNLFTDCSGKPEAEAISAMS